MDETSEVKITDPMTDEPVRRRTRTGRKRVSFKTPPRPAPAVKELWRQASEEERKKAHMLCMAILEYWVGRASKEEVAKRLSVPGLRVWQLSQQALSGMLAGLLRQPRRRVKVVADPANPEIDPKPLRQRIAELEKKLSRTEDLVRVLKHLPWAREGTNGGSGSKASGKQQVAKRSTAKRRRTKTNRKAAPVAQASGETEAR